MPGPGAAPSVDSTAASTVASAAHSTDASTVATALEASEADGADEDGEGDRAGNDVDAVANDGEDNALDFTVLTSLGPSLEKLRVNLIHAVENAR